MHCAYRKKRLPLFESYFFLTANILDIPLFSFPFPIISILNPKYRLVLVTTDLFLMSIKRDLRTMFKIPELCLKLVINLLNIAIHPVVHGYTGHCLHKENKASSASKTFSRFEEFSSDLISILLLLLLLYKYCRLALKALRIEPGLTEQAS